MRKDLLPFAQSSIGEPEIAAVADAMRSGWLTTGPRVREFEQRFAEFVGAPDAVATNSCTAALHMALMFFGIREGHEVITSPMTFTATAAVIEHVGAKPVFIDIVDDSLNLNPARILDALTPRTRAIIPVHFAGYPAPMTSVTEIAHNKHLHVVEDAAHALGADYYGNKVGNGKYPAAFSFYVTKNLSTVDGGMLTGPKTLLSDARCRRLHGVDRDSKTALRGSWDYNVIMPGLKYNMTDVDAAIGLVQMAKLAENNQRRADIAALYNAAFVNNEMLEIPSVPPPILNCAPAVHAWHIYNLRLNLKTIKINRAEFIDEMRKLNIACVAHCKPLHMHSYYANKYALQPQDFPIAYREYLRIVSLPLWPGMTDGDVADVITAVETVLQRSKR